MIITIKANKGEGLAFTASKIATTFSNGKNVIIIADKDDVVDNVSIVPNAPVVAVEHSEWESFLSRMDIYIQALLNSFWSTNNMSRQSCIYILIDGRYIDEDTLKIFIDKCFKNIGIVVPIVMKYE